MSSCNACANERLKQTLKSKYLLLNNAVYELDAEPLQDQEPCWPCEFEGRPIRFRSWFGSLEHTRTGECKS